MIGISLKVANSFVQPKTATVSRAFGATKPLAQDTFVSQIKSKTKELFERLYRMDYDSLNDKNKLCQECFPTVTKCEKFGQKEYDKMSELEKEFARLITGKKIAVNQYAQSAVKIAQGIKDSLDLKYGKDGYSVLGVGRSPSGLTQIMEYEGAKSKSVPFSYAVVNALPCVGLTEFEKIDWKKYFAHFGLDKKTLCDKSRVTILTDYIHSGKSIDYFEMLLNKYFPNNNVKKVGLIELSESIPEDIAKKYDISKNDLSRFTTAIEDCDLKTSLCTCPHYMTQHAFNEPYKESWALQSKLSFFDYFDKKNLLASLNDLS